MGRPLPSTDRGQSMLSARGGLTTGSSDRLPGFPSSFFWAIVFGLRPRIAIGFLGSDAALGSDLVVSAAVLQPGLLAGERLPAQDRDIDIGRVQLDRVANAAGHLGGNDRGAGAAERLVDGLTRR